MPHPAPRTGRVGLLIGVLAVLSAAAFLPRGLQRPSDTQAIAAIANGNVHPASDVSDAPVSARDASAEVDFAAQLAAELEAGEAAAEPRPEDETRIVVSVDERHLWYISASGDTLLSAPVAVGMNRGFEFNGRRFHFETPRGKRKVLSKSPDPVWTVPDWHYYERARHQKLEVVRLEKDSRIELEDGTILVVDGDQVGRINQFGNFWPFTPGNEIIFDGTVYIPPIHTAQRRVPDALGPYKLDTGDGYLIHGTHLYNEDSIGDAVSHGCVRMNNDDLERLYWMVEPGTPVYIR